MKLTFRPHWVALFFLLLSLGVYRQSWVGVPLADAHFLTRQRIFHQSDAGYLWNAFSYPRTREIRRGSAQFLFRPGTMGMLALTDILFQDRLEIIGLMSLVWHAMACFCLYWIVADLLSPIAGILIGIAFGVQFSGAEMILWRHINPYMFSVVTFGMGAWMLSRSRLTAAALFFFASSMFHETAGLVLPVLAGVAYFGTRRLDLTKCFGYPAAAYWVLNIVDLIARRAPFGLATSGAQLNHLSLPEMVTSVFGIFLTAFVTPFLAHFNNLGFPVEKREWTYLNEPHAIFMLVGAGFLAFLVGFGIYAFRKMRKTEEPTLPLVAFSLVLFFGATVAGLIKGRLLNLGLKYLSQSSYYFYLSNYLLWLIAAFGLRIALRERTPSKVLVMSLGYIAFLQAVPDYFLVQRHVAVVADRQNLVGRRVAGIRDFINEHPEFCYAGALDLPQDENDILITGLFRKSCAMKSGKAIGLVGEELMELPAIERKSVELDLAEGNYREQGGRLSTPTPSENTEVGRGMVISRQRYSINSVGVTLHQMGVASLVFGYDDPWHFYLATAGHDIMAVQHYTPQGPGMEMEEHIDGNALPMQLTIRKIGSRFYLFKDGIIAAPLPKLSSIDGKVGLHDAGVSGTTVFSDLFVEPNTEAHAALRNLATLR